MNINDLYIKNKEFMKNHREEFNFLKRKNRKRRNEINHTINQRQNQFERNKKRHSNDFNLIRNKQL